MLTWWQALNLAAMFAAVLLLAARRREGWVLWATHCLVWAGSCASVAWPLDFAYWALAALVGARAFGAWGRNARHGTRVVYRVGRNDPCGCGSGEKFKHCCGSRRRVESLEVVEQGAR